MKSLLIAASLATAMLAFAAPAQAQNTRPGMNQSNANDEGRRDRATDGAMARGDRQDDRRNDGRWNDRNDRGSGWNGHRCHNVRRHHRWVRVCNRR